MNTHTIDTPTPTPTVRRLERSRSDRMLAGVCGGLARYFDINPAFYRVGFVVLTLLGGAGILVYVAAALVIPNEGEEDSIAAAALKSRRERPWPLVGLGLVAVAGAVLLSRATLWPHGDAAWIFLLLAGAVILWITRRVQTDAEKTEATTEPAVLAKEDSHRIGRALKWFAIVCATLLALFFISLAAIAAVFHVHLNAGIGDRKYTVASVSDLNRDYKLGVGNLRLDLSRVQFPVGATHVDTRVDIGNLKVIVPARVALQVDAHAQAGNVNLLGDETNGTSVDRTLDQSGTRVLVLDAHVGAGNLQVLRAVR